MRDGSKVPTEARPKDAQTRVDFELGAVRVANDAIACSVQVFVPAPRHARALVRAFIQVHDCTISAPDDEQPIAAGVARVEAPAPAILQLCERTKPNARQPTPFGGGGPLGAHLSRSVNRKICE